MITLEEACKDLLLYATAASALLENASRQMASLGKPVFTHNFKEYSSMLEIRAADVFRCMNGKGYGVYFLPDTSAPSYFFEQGMSYSDYRHVMLGSSETAASPDPWRTINLCAEYAEKVFQAAMDAAIRSAKDGDSLMAQVIAGRGGLLHASALVWLWMEDAIAGVMRMLIFIPDFPDDQGSQPKLDQMTEVGDGGMTKHLPPEFIFMRREDGSGFTAGQIATVPGYGRGRFVRCDSQEAADFIEGVVSEWNYSLCTANDIW